MSNINCVLIDDEPFALDILEDDLLAFQNIKVLSKFSSPIGVDEFLKNNAIDLMFCDIQMPEMLGTQLIKSLEKPPMVIFTTAYHQYAVEGFELNAIDYLMKPIRKERLAQALDKVSKQLSIQKSATENFIILNIEYQKVKLYYEEIIYIEGLKDYVKIYLENRVHPIMTRSNLKGMEGKLSEEHFARIHNSFIVNKKKIITFNQSKIKISNFELPVGKSYYGNLST